MDRLGEYKETALHIRNSNTDRAYNGRLRFLSGCGHVGSGHRDEHDDMPRKRTVIIRGGNGSLPEGQWKKATAAVSAIAAARVAAQDIG